MLALSGCTVLAWGANTHGQSDPSGAVGDVAGPTGVSVDAIDLAAGISHTCEIRLDRSVWCWGDNQAGQLGDGTTNPHSGAIQVGDGFDWRRIDANELYTCGIRLDDSLWCWGGYPHHLNDWPNVDPSTPVAVAPEMDWTEVSAGESSTCAIHVSGDVYCWGDNQFGVVGDGTHDVVEEPKLIATGPYVDVAVGIGSCGIKDDGTLWCWGDAAPPWGDEDITPQQVGTASGWTSVTSEERHFCGIQSDHSLWCWAAGYDGQLGMGDEVTWQDEPTQVGTDSDWKSVTAGARHTCAIRLDGSLWCWGDNTWTQVGTGSDDDATTPLLVDDESVWLMVEAGDAHTAGTAL